MAKNTLLTIDGIHRKVKEKFITVDSIYHKIKKAYISAGGVWRPCFSTVPIDYYGKISPLSLGRSEIKSTFVDDYVLFAGGDSSNVKSSVIDVYDGSLTKRNNEYLSRGKTGMGTVNFAGYAMFAGGFTGNETLDEIDMYDENLTKSNFISLGFRRLHPGASVVGEHVIFGAGFNYYSNYNGELNGYMTNYVDAFDEDFARKDVSLFTKSCALSAGVSFADSVMFGGRRPPDVLDYQIYDRDLTHRTIPGDMNEVAFAVGVNGEYALYVSRQGDRIVGYDKDSHKVLDRTFDTKVFYHSAGTSLGKYALISGAGRRTVWCFDENLNLSKLENLSEGRYGLSAATLNNKAFFAGGVPYSTNTLIDVYNLNEI